MRFANSIYLSLELYKQRFNIYPSRKKSQPSDETMIAQW